jgi:hypothetical protein
MNQKVKILFGLFVAAGTSALLGQPAPASPPAAVSTVSGNISQFNYGPDGRVQGFVVAPNTLISLLPDWAMQVELLAKPGDPVRATGYAAPAASGIQIMQPKTLSVAGRTLNVAEPSLPAPYAGTGIIRSLNYGPQGEVNGFVLQSGIIALTPPMGTGDVSVVKPGASISVSGFARTTPTGRTLVDVQTITAKGQTIAMNPLPPGPGGRGSRPGRGPGRDPGPGAAPPPPPPPSDAAAPGPPPDPVAPGPPPPPPAQ